MDEATNSIEEEQSITVISRSNALDFPGMQTLELRPYRTVHPELEERYERLRIPTEPAPPIRPVPHRFLPRVNKRKLALMLFREFWRFFFSNPILDKRINLASRWRALFDRPCKYGAFSGRLGGFKPIPGKCAGCMRCLIEHPGIIEDIIINEEFKNLQSIGWRAEEVETVLREAATGKEKVGGTGYGGPFAGRGWDSIWLDMSEIVRPTRDGKEGREYIATASEIGRKEARLSGDRLNVLTIQLPIIFDCLAEHETNETLQLSIAEAARGCGILSIVPLSFYRPLRKRYYDYLGLKIHENEIEQFEALFDELRPRVIELESTRPEAFESMKEVAQSSILIARLRADKDVEGAVREISKSGVDGFHIFADDRGYEFASDSENPRHMKDIIRDINHSLVREGVRSEVTLLGSGGIYLAEHVPKAIGCGLDMVAINTTIHVALQSEFRGPGNQARISPTVRDFKWGARRLRNVMAAWHAQLVEALSAMGKRDVRRLTGDEGRLIFYEDMRREAFCDIEKVVCSV